MATVPADVEGPSDAELISAVRKGTVSAYGSLYERHVTSAYNLARQLTRSPAEADDLVSEAFAKVLDTLRAGRGPDSSFRAYLLTALRHTAYDKTRRDRKIELSDDVESAGGAAVAEPFTDPAVTGLERSLAAQAFARLPERWQAVLWHTEIEGQSPAEIAPILGLTPNGVSALAYRAREGLRQAYLQVHLAETSESRCRATAERLGAWTRAGLARREKAQVEAHLDECARCRSLAAELADVNGAMRGFVAPLVLGVGTVGYLAATGATKGGVLAAAGAAGAAGASAGGAANAAASAPRQFVGVAASSVALVAAIAIGLTSGGANQEIPDAAPATEQAAPPAQDPPAGQQPPRQPADPPAEEPPAEEAPADDPPAQDPPAQDPPAGQEPPADDPAADDPAPAPLPAMLTATPPDVPVGLVAGGEQADLPISVTNSGGTLSEPVTATLALPPGVTAVPARPDGFAAGPALRLDAPRRAELAADTVNCPGGVGTVTCGSERGLRPGESVTLRFVLVATEGTGGVITGTVNAGSATSVRFQVRVEVSEPAVVDGVDLVARARWSGLLPVIWQRPTVVATVTNTGTSSRPVSMTVDRPGRLRASGQEMTCTADLTTTTCGTAAELAPGEKMKVVLDVDLDTRPERSRDEDQPDHEVRVTAELGTASDIAVVRFEDWDWPWEQDPPTPPTSSSPPPTPSAPPPTSEEETPPPARGPTTDTPRPPTQSEQPPSEHDRPPAAPPSEPPTSTPPDRPEPPTSTPPAPGGGGGLGGLLDWLLGGR